MTPPEALGTIMPDLLPIVGTRPDVGLLPPEVVTGRAIHHRSDHLFHQHRRFTTLVRDLRRTLLEAGLGPGPSHAGAHVGVELLLDGTLSDPALLLAFREALALGPLVRTAFPAGGRTRWDEVARRVADDDPSALVDPGDVARRLHRVLARRARLALRAGDVPRMAEALGNHRPGVVEAATPLLSDVARDLARPPGAGLAPLP